MAKKVYAVRQGRQTGIFSTWSECEKQVKGFSGAEYKSFTTKEAAFTFLKGGDGCLPFSDTVKSPADTVRDETVVKGDMVSMDVIDMASEDMAVAYVDGSFDKRSGDFSYGMVILYQGQEFTFCERMQDKELAQMHNVAGEIKGAEAAMRYAVEHGLKRIVIYHDYEGIAKWCNGAWKANKEGTKAYRAYYESIVDILQIEFVKVKGHSNDKYNDMADALAKEALGI